MEWGLGAWEGLTLDPWDCCSSGKILPPLVEKKNFMEMTWGLGLGYIREFR